MATKKKAVKKEQQWQPLTRGGYEYRIYATDGVKPYSIHGAVKQRGWRVRHWQENGLCWAVPGSGFDLLPVKAAKKGAKHGN